MPSPLTRPSASPGWALWEKSWSSICHWPATTWCRCWKPKGPRLWCRICLDFFNYCLLGGEYRHEFLGAGITADMLAKVGIKSIRAVRQPAIDALKKSRRFAPPVPIERIAEATKPFLSLGNQYGEGWFLAGEMVELITSGTPNVICIQPFACLPNHVVGKGVIKVLKKAYPQANIAAVDYDPGASEVNQLNRIKLMLSAAKQNL